MSKQTIIFSVNDAADADFITGVLSSYGYRDFSIQKGDVFEHFTRDDERTVARAIIAERDRCASLCEDLNLQAAANLIRRKKP